VTASGVPPGWGEPVYDRLDAEIAYAMMSINAVKGVEIGAGFASVVQKGSEHGDEMTPVEDLEAHDMPIADFTMEDMKKQRVQLKDELYHMLLAFRSGQQSAKA
jgi:uncharacterized protein YdcH (DUF465 family)